MTPPPPPPEATSPEAARPEEASTHQGRHLRWPAGRFYWALLDGSVLPSVSRDGTRRLTERLGYLFEGMLPGVPIEQVHPVYRRLPGPGRRYLACGVPRSVLEQHVGAEALTLTPTSLPGFVSEEVDLAGLNLLTGPFLPRVLRKLQLRWVMHVGLILVVCVVLLVLGFERRVQATQAQIKAIAAAKMDLYEQVLGPAALHAAAGSQPPALRLTAELRRLEQTRSSDITLVDAVDCSAILSAILACWPGDVHVQTKSISVAPTSIIIRAQVATMADAQRMADALRVLPGWLLNQPQSVAQADHVDVTLRFEPGEAEP